MEDRDTISADAVRRLEDLENIVRKHKIVTSGDGDVTGGFGKLPEGTFTPQQRLANLRNAVDSYNLSGENVNVAGNFDDGFTFS